MRILRVHLAQNLHHMSGAITLTALLWDDKLGPKQKTEISSRLESHPFIAASVDEEEISLDYLTEMIR